MLIPPGPGVLIPISDLDYRSWSSSKSLSQWELYERAEIHHAEGREVFWLTPGMFHAWEAGKMSPWLVSEDVR
jgi:hypothetical protein